MILAVLLVGGFFKSLQFTSINTLAYADIEHESHEPGDQLRQRGAAIVAVGRRRLWRAGARGRAHGPAGRERGRPGDFPSAFILVAAIAASSALIFARLPKEAGASLSARARPAGR